MHKANMGLLISRYSLRRPALSELGPGFRRGDGGAAGDFGAGRDSHREVRRVLAGHQAEGSGGARRHRVPHLFRPAG